MTDSNDLDVVVVEDADGNLVDAGREVAVTVRPPGEDAGVPAVETPDPLKGKVFSASRLKTWMACPMKANLHYNQHEPQRQNGKASFGKVIHAALELYNNTGNYQAAVALFDDLWHNPEKIDATPDYWPKMTSWEGLRQRGREVLRTVHETTKWETREVLATEHPFLVPFGRYFLTGFVDLLELRRSGNGNMLLRVVDYKTASRRPNKAALYLDVQFTVYIYASLQPEFWTGVGEKYPGIPNGEWLFETMKDMPRRAIWSHLWDAKEIDAGPRDLDDFMQVYRVCTEIDKADQAGIHIPHIGEACELCDYQKVCGLTIPSPAEVAAQDNAWL